MQTFLPAGSYYQSAEILDNKRLGKQRVECKQIYLALTVPDYGWKNHPAVKMWKGYGYQLCLYGSRICVEWRNRGFKDSLLPFFEERAMKLFVPFVPIYPHWLLGQEAIKITNSHRSNLLRKDPIFYGKYNWDVPNDLPYYWPVK